MTTISPIGIAPALAFGLPTIQKVVSPSGIGPDHALGIPSFQVFIPTTILIAKAVEDWAVSVIPSLNSYDYAPRSLSQALPLVLSEVKRKQHQELTTTESGFQQYQFQQTSVNLWNVDLMILVDPSDPWSASQILYAMTDTLGDALAKDLSLGRRVSFASGDYDVSFDPPEFEYADGTIARVATMSIVVGNQEGT